MPLSGKELAKFYFTQDEPNGFMWTCKCGAKRAQKGSGYSNLCSHITLQHPEYKKLEKNNETVLERFYPKKTQSIHAWIKLVVDGLLPFSFVENKTAREYMNPDSICINTFMKYLDLLSKTVQKKIANILPDKFH